MQRSLHFIVIQLITLTNKMQITLLEYHISLLTISSLKSIFHYYCYDHI